MTNKCSRTNLFSTTGNTDWTLLKPFTKKILSKAIMN